MKRVLKFRGKRVDNGEWCYGYLVDYNMICDWKSDEKHAFEIDAKTVGQFTGLQTDDDKREDIYEGDILKLNDDSYKVVVFDDGGYILLSPKEYKILKSGSHYYFNDYARADDLGKYYYDCGLLPCWKIIGNIHDTPELLNTDNETETQRDFDAIGALKKDLEKNELLLNEYIKLRLPIFIEPFNDGDDNGYLITDADNVARFFVKGQKLLNK